MASGFGQQPFSSSKNKFLSLAGKELFRLDTPEEEPELEREANRLFQITEELHRQFDQACEILLSAYVDQNGAGQLGMTAVGNERKAWIIPIAATDEMQRKIEELKSSDRFGQCVHLYHQSSPIPPHQAMVVQVFKGGNTFEILYRLREDLKGS